MKFNLREFSGYFLVLLFILIFFGFLWFYSPLPYANDGHYHIKTAQLMGEKGIVLKEFPWLYFTSLNRNFVDKHFLYHVYLMPFTLLLDLSLALKLASLLLTAITFLFFYFLLKENKIKFAEIWTIVFALSSSYLDFRLILGRAIPLGILLCLIGIYFMQKKNYWGIAVISFIFVWSYAAFPAIGLLALTYSIGLMLQKESAGKIFAFCLLGLIAGMIINPYFPQNISLGITTDLKAALFREDSMGIVEWNPVSSWNFLTNDITVIFLLIALLYFFAFDRIKLSKESKALFLPMVLFLLMSLKSIRIIDFFIPIAILFFAFSFNEIYSKISRKELIALGLILAVFCGSIAISSIDSIKSEAEKPSFAPCAEWLKQNSPENSIVFLWQYDDFPKMIYFDSRNYYTEGLDSYYLKDFNAELFEAKKEITEQNKLELVKQDFNSNFIFIERTGTLGKKIDSLKNSGKVKKFFDSNACAVFELE